MTQEQYEPLAQTARECFGAIDCSGHIQRKANLDYLKWTFAVKCLLDNFPESDFSFRVEPSYEGSTTYMTYCTIDLRRGMSSVQREMFLPVMDYKNKSIANPTTRDINDANWRCFVKCMAVHFNLGLEIYNGGDFTSTNAELSEDKVAKIYELIEETESDIDQFCIAFKVDCVESLTEGDYSRALQALNKKKEKLNAQD